MRIDQRMQINQRVISVVIVSIWACLFVLIGLCSLVCVRRPVFIDLCSSVPSDTSVLYHGWDD